MSRLRSRGSLAVGVSTVLLTGLAFADTTAATTEPPSDGIRGCAPACVEGGTAWGPIPAGEFTTGYFLDGHLTLTFEEGWESAEDQGVEFHAFPAGEGGSNRVLFWSDLIPVGPDRVDVEGIPNTAAAFTEWFGNRPGVELSEPMLTTVGAMKIPALTFDWSVAADAENEDPGCPGPPCIEPFGWVNGARYGTGAGWVMRMYVSDVVYGGEQHTFTIAIEASGQATLDEFTPAAERLIATATAPFE